jgi:hypothetical protein
MMGECFAVNGDYFIKTDIKAKGYDQDCNVCVHLKMGCAAFPPFPPQLEVKKVKIRIEHE